jgi:two-component system response regulator HydG
MTTKPRILVVDDEPAMAEMLAAGLTRSGNDVVVHTNPREALEAAQQQSFDCVVTDVRMAHMNGVELCSEIVRSCPGVPVIVVTAFGSIEAAVDAIRAGAFEFITKPFELEAVRHVVSRAVEHRRLSDTVARLESALREAKGQAGFIGSSQPMKGLYDLIERLGAKDTTVLIAGESGSGKELVARALHDRSVRHNRPFVAVNCAALPEPLLEGELFGHVRGAFTDAKAAHVGLFQQADGGTLFLDEIGEFPIGLQPKLLRVLQERSVRPLGGQKEHPVNVRIMAATNRDLEQEVEQNRFRADLLYRIQVVQVDVPPLRVRGNDVLLLAQHFVEGFAASFQAETQRIHPEAAERLLAYAWPGNVRELQNCIERAVILSRGQEILPADLPEKIRAPRNVAPETTSKDPADWAPMEEIERRYILSVFKAVRGNKSLAAKILGFNRKTLYRKLRQFGVSTDPNDE